MPKVSIIIPTLQSAKFVGRTIESVLAQTYTDYEIIVVEGGSTDGTIEILNSYGSHIEVVKQIGRGVTNARNVGVLRSKGDYIAFLDSDDERIEIIDKFQNIKELLGKEGNASLNAARIIIDEMNEIREEQ